MVDQQARADGGWRGVWERGSWWKALIAAVAYLVIYEGASLVIGLLWGKDVNPNLLADPTSVFLGLLLPLIVGAIVLAVFVGSLGWFRPLFGKQPIGGRGWMWIAVVLTVIPIALRLIGID